MNCETICARYELNRRVKLCEKLHGHIQTHICTYSQIQVKRVNLLLNVWIHFRPFGIVFVQQIERQRKREKGERERGEKRSNKTSYTAKIVIISEYITLHLVDINVYNLNFTLVWELAYICDAIRSISFSVNEFVLLFIHLIHQCILMRFLCAENMLCWSTCFDGAVAYLSRQNRIYSSFSLQIFYFVLINAIIQQH